MSKKVLIAEDEVDMVYAIKMLLEANGYEVITAPDGQAALEAARAEKPDLMVLDLMMPKIDGYKVCRMLKFDEKYRGIPIIMLTARAQNSDEKLGYEVGADAYFTKPYEPETLLAKIKELIAG